MKSYKGAICDYYKYACDIRRKLIKEIIEFLVKYGKHEDKKYSLSIDWNIDELVYSSPVLMLTDRRLNQYSWENITSMTYDTELDCVMFDSEYGGVYSDYILINDLLDFYECLVDIEECLQKGTLTIDNGEITIKE